MLTYESVLQEVEYPLDKLVKFFAAVWVLSGIAVVIYVASERGRE